jgi:hypothetical protein
MYVDTQFGCLGKHEVKEHPAVRVIGEDIALVVAAVKDVIPEILSFDACLASHGESL